MLAHRVSVSVQFSASARRTRAAALASALVSLSLVGCAGGAGLPMELGSAPVETKVSDNSAPKTELQKAADYWGKESAKNPNDAQAAVNYARNLKALGAKQEAMQVLQTAHSVNPSNKQLNSEYGRLALETDQIAAAQKLLDQAADPVSPDWKTVSAKGTLLAKQGKHREAIVQFEQARMLAPDQSSVLNNLALAHAMDGRAEKAETMLKEALAAAPSDERIARNLSLVLGLQGKHDESKLIMAKALTPDAAAEDASYLKQMVKSQPASLPVAQAPSSKKVAQVSGKSSISTASIAAPATARAAPGKSMVPSADAANLVQKLADGYQKTPADRPVDLTPKN